MARLQLGKSRYIEEYELCSFLGTISTENSNLQPIRNYKDLVTDTQQHGDVGRPPEEEGHGTAQGDGGPVTPGEICDSTLGTDVGKCTLMDVLEGLVLLLETLETMIELVQLGLLCGRVDLELEVFDFRLLVEMFS